MPICLVGTQWGYYLGTQIRQFYGGPLIVCGRDRERTQRIAARLNAQWVTGFETALRNPDLRAFVLAVPAPLHRQMGLDALREGKHVLIEKPLSVDLESCDDLIKTARESGVVLATGENVPFRPDLREVRRLLPFIGERRLFIASALNSGARSGLETGILLDFTIHQIRALRELFGEPDLVYASSADVSAAGPPAGDNITIVLSSSSAGWQATLTSSWQASAGICPEFIISGTEGAVKIWPQSPAVDLYPCRPSRLSRLVSMVRPSWLQTLIQSPELQRRRIKLPRGDRMGYQAELRSFLQAIDRETPDVSSAMEARRDLEIALAAKRSLESGRPVPCIAEPQLQVA